MNNSAAGGISRRVREQDAIIDVVSLTLAPRTLAVRGTT